ncbi:hypothetical protein [Helicobacter sp. UBA3407]|uniref:hypothetical protein n=1 Tax=Helicobacter sp. UBA3407 TaxID=1946588 RepID=UPI00260A7D79|nr:hypothetical protein [Helicobacter sp. UBA3407]
MFHIVFNADENYIKYNAVLMMSIIKIALKQTCKQEATKISPPHPRKTLVSKAIASIF